MKRAIGLLFIIFCSIQQCIAQSDSISESELDYYNGEEQQRTDSEIYVEDSPYGPFFPKDSLAFSYISKVAFKKNFKKEYKKLAAQYDVDPQKEPKQYNLGWLARLLDLFPGINVDLLVLIARIVIYSLIIAIFFYILKYFFYKDINWNPFKKSNRTIAQDESTEGELTGDEYERKIQIALNAGDKRIAIRYYYLWLLQKLNKYHHIKFHPEKTNSDYLYELTNVKYRTSFANLSYIYDYTWYGEAELNEEDFARVKDNFDTTISQII